MHRWGKWGPVPPGAWLQFLPAPTAAAEAGQRLSPKTHILKPTIPCQEVKKLHSTNFEISFGIKINLSLQLPMASKLISPAFVGRFFFLFLFRLPRSNCIVATTTLGICFKLCNVICCIHTELCQITKIIKRFQKTFTFISSLFSL